MNKLFLILIGCCFLMSCTASNAISPIFSGKNSNVLLDTDQVKSAPSKLQIEDKTVTILNQLFNSDAANKNMVLVISNESDCDFTMNILGNKSYSLPVASKKSESIVVEQGDYEIKSEVCKSPYKVFKTLSENTQLSIKYSVVKVPAPETIPTEIQ